MSMPTATRFAGRGQDGQLRFLRNEGGHVQGQLKLPGLVDRQSQQYRHVSTARQILGHTLGTTEWPGNRPAGHTKLDSVQTVWTNGVVDNRIDVVHSEPMDIVIVGSWSRDVPYLYAWAKRLSFLTDIVGGALGLALARYRMDPIPARSCVSATPTNSPLPRQLPVERATGKVIM
jgi:hypothetical protein